MDITLKLSCDYQSVFLVNGKFIEGGEIVYAQNEVVYITVLPLSAVLLPYTVKLVGEKVHSNNELASCFRISDNNYLLRFLPRYNYVYSVPSKAKENDLVEKFFKLIKENQPDKARLYLSEELSESIDNQALLGFFEDFFEIVVHDRSKGLYYLIDNEQNGILYNFEMHNGVIENIIEIKN